MTDPMDRRTFIRKGAGAGVGFGVLGNVPAVGGLPAPGRSYPERPELPGALLGFQRLTAMVRPLQYK